MSRFNKNDLVRIKKTEMLGIIEEIGTEGHLIRCFSVVDGRPVTMRAWFKDNELEVLEQEEYIEPKADKNKLKDWLKQEINEMKLEVLKKERSMRNDFEQLMASNFYATWTFPAIDLLEKKVRIKTLREVLKKLEEI